MHGENILLGNVYAPNVQDDAFYASLLSQLADMDCPNMIIGGDFNCALCPMMDRSPSQTVISKNANAVLNINREFDLLDIWRQSNIHFTLILTHRHHALIIFLCLGV